MIILEPSFEGDGETISQPISALVQVRRVTAFLFVVCDTISFSYHTGTSYLKKSLCLAGWRDGEVVGGGGIVVFFLNFYFFRSSWRCE